MKAFLMLLLVAGCSHSGVGASLDQLRWMTGSWMAEGDEGSSTEELWTEPAGGLMLGLNRTVPAGGKARFEFLRIEERAGQVVYLASPGGAAPTPFTLVEAGGQRAVFENREHDFPQRIVYWKAGDDLCARVETVKGEGEEWCWKPKPR